MAVDDALWTMEESFLAPGETLFTPVLGVICRVTRLAEALLAGFLLLMSVMMSKAPTSASSFLSLYWSVLSDFRFVQFVLVVISFVGYGYQFITASSWKKGGTSEGRDSYFAPPLSIARRSRWLRYITICHLGLIIVYFSGSPLENRFQVLINKAQEASLYAGGSETEGDWNVVTKDADPTLVSWKICLYIKLFCSILAIGFSALTTVGPEEAANIYSLGRSFKASK